MTRFSKNADGSYSKYITVEGIHYKITLTSKEWNTISRRKIKDHIVYWQQDPTKPLRYGTYDIVDALPTGNLCEKCNKYYKSRSGYLKHINKYHPVPEENDVVPTNERTTIMNNTTNNNTTNNHHIHINLPPLHNFGDENPNWLTSDVLLRVIQDIPTAIPNLIREKHFNDRFPENHLEVLIQHRQYQKYENLIPSRQEASG